MVYYAQLISVFKAKDMFIVCLHSFIGFLSLNKNSFHICAS